MVEREAVTYISDFLGEDVMLVEVVIPEISKAPDDVRHHLEERCRTAEKMEQFLRIHSDHFIVENNRVGSYDVSLASGRAKAVDYFKNVLHLYNDPPDYMKFRGHIDHLFICKMVEENVIKCISSMLDDGVHFVEALRSEIQAVTEYLDRLCWSLDSLEKFLVHYDEYFIVENGRVCVYDSQLDSGRGTAAEYYAAELQKEMEKYGEWPNYKNFRGHIGQASKDIQDYLNTFYPEEEFKDFLLEYPDVFEVLDDNTVCLIEHECVNYFKTKLQNGGIRITALRYQISSAPNHVREFMCRYYNGDSFLDFLEDNSETFYVEDDYVYLN